MVQSWNNNDGLYLKFGVDKATANTGGEYRAPSGKLHEVEIKITLSALTQTETILNDQIFIPAGARIHEVELLTQTAAATGTAIDVGLIRSSNRSTEIDYNGFLAAAPTAVMDLAGERTIYTAATTVPASATGTGALIGTTLANTGMISASMTDATAFTAGVVHVIVRYYMP